MRPNYRVLPTKENIMLECSENMYSRTGRKMWACLY